MSIGTSDWLRKCLLELRDKTSFNKGHEGDKATKIDFVHEELILQNLCKKVGDRRDKIFGPLFLSIEPDNEKEYTKIYYRHTIDSMLPAYLNELGFFQRGIVLIGCWYCEIELDFFLNYFLND